MDVHARNLFHKLFLARQNQQPQHNAYSDDLKRRKMMADLQERERSHAHNHHDDDGGGGGGGRVRREEESRIAQKLKREIANIRGMMAAKTRARAPARPALDRGRVLKVTWEENNGGYTYTADTLRQLFGEVGEVEDVLIGNKNKKKKKESGRPGGGCSALVVMAYKDSAVAACWSVLGDVSNPLMVQPLDDSTPPPPPPPPANHTKFEESVLTKLKQAAAAAANRQKGNVVV